jgi:hypothetical protein
MSPTRAVEMTTARYASLPYEPLDHAGYSVQYLQYLQKHAGFARTLPIRQDSGRTPLMHNLHKLHNAGVPKTGASRVGEQA